MVTSFNGCCIVTQILVQSLTNVNIKREQRLNNVNKRGKQDALLLDYVVDSRFYLRI